MRIKELVREDVENLEPYIPAPSYYDVKLNANESPFDIPDEIKEEIWSEVKDEKFSLYYDPTALELREKLSHYTGVKKDELVVGNGSDEIIMVLLFTFAGPRRKVIIPSPTFPIYETFTRISGAQPVRIPLIKPDKSEPWQLNMEKIRENYLNNDEYSIFFVCYPNNPTGSYFPEEHVLEIIENFNGLVIIDEAYFEFGRKSFVNYINRYENIAIVRTFSKAFCLASMRIGYLIANKDIINEVYKVKLPYNIGLFSQKAAKVMLDKISYINTVCEKITTLRNKLYQELSKIEGITPYPSITNFILCRFNDRPVDEVYQKLIQKSIIIRKLEDPALYDCLRISVGDEKDNRILLDNLKLILKEG